MSDTQFFEGFSKESPLTLESGKTIGPVTMAYESYGQLNDSKNNVILVCHALTGDAHASSKNNQDGDGWWHNFIGPGKPLDTNKYFVLCPNVIGGCKGSTGPASINPDTNKPYGVTFPLITIKDMVTAQKALMDHLDITSILLVIGGSMGGMQALQWSISYPDFVKSCIPIAATSKLSPQALAFDAVGREAIKMDQNWNQGDYYTNEKAQSGLALARMIGHITYLSDESMGVKFGRKLQEKSQYDYEHGVEFQIESYLQHQGSKFISKFDANSYLYLTKAISYFDLESSYGSLEKALKESRCQFLIISISSDWLYTPEQSKDIVKSLMKLHKPVSYCDLDSPYGHDAFLLENEKLSSVVKSFLNHVGESK